MTTQNMICPGRLIILKNIKNGNPCITFGNGNEFDMLKQLDVYLPDHKAITIITLDAIQTYHIYLCLICYLQKILYTNVSPAVFFESSV